MIDVRPVDLADDELMAELARIEARSSSFERPWESPRSPEAWTAWRRSPDSGEHQELYAAFDDGRPVGIASVWLFLLDNTDKGYVQVHVDPAARRRGVGAALLERVVGVVEADGRPLVLADGHAPPERLADHPDRRFAERHGFCVSNIEVIRQQRLPVPEATIEAWAASAAERAGGYTIETHVNSMPEELVESFTFLLGQLAVDAPTGEVDYEAETMTPQRLAERFAMAEAMAHDVLDTVALTPERVVVAHSTLFAPRAPSDGPHTAAFQWGTFVHRDHRGHRLGLAVKAANLRELQRRHPHVELVDTQNAETNQWMIAINELMGYEKVDLSLDFVRR